MVELTFYAKDCGTPKGKGKWCQAKERTKKSHVEKGKGCKQDAILCLTEAKVVKARTRERGSKEIVGHVVKRATALASVRNTLRWILEV